MSDTTDPALLAAFVAEIDAALGRTQHVVFRLDGQGGRAIAPNTMRPRTLVGFATPDAALGFAQQNALGQARTRTIGTGPLLLAALRDARIAAVLLATEEQPPARGTLPQGMLLARATIVERLGTAADSATAQEMAS